MGDVMRRRQVWWLGPLALVALSACDSEGGAPRAHFEGIVGELLKQLGYELSAAEITGTVEDRIDRCLDWWQEQRMSMT